jgi:hypothetical protein
VAEDDDCDIDRAQHRELVGLLEKTSLAFEESSVHEMRKKKGLEGERTSQLRHLHGAIPIILDGLDFDLSSTHSELKFFRRLSALGVHGSVEYR